MFDCQKHIHLALRTDAPLGGIQSNAFRAKAYTLIEVLVALFIFSIVTVLILMTIGHITKNKTVIAQTEMRLQELQTAMAIIHFDLSQAVAKTTFDANKNIVGTFVANNTTLQFTKFGNINPNYQLRRSTLEKVTYSLKNGTLVRQSDGEQIILTKVNNIKWSFLGSKLERYDVWPPVQELKYQIPQAVEMTLSLEDVGTLEQLIELPGKAYEVK